MNRQRQLLVSMGLNAQLTVARRRFSAPRPMSVIPKPAKATS
jgi:hypothetical protein